MTQTCLWNRKAMKNVWVQFYFGNTYMIHLWNEMLYSENILIAAILNRFLYIHTIFNEYAYICCFLFSRFHSSFIFCHLFLKLVSVTSENVATFLHSCLNVNDFLIFLFSLYVEILFLLLYITTMRYKITEKIRYSVVRNLVTPTSLPNCRNSC